MLAATINDAHHAMLVMIDSVWTHELMLVHCLIHRTHIIQYHEVIGGLIGPWGERAALFFNVVSLVGLAVVQIIACASDAYYLYDGLNKR